MAVDILPEKLTISVFSVAARAEASESASAISPISRRASESDAFALFAWAMASLEAVERPLTLSRFAGAGSHRYPLGFSGDTAIYWSALKFQPYFTATASNIGYGWWSHDIGGHRGGIHDGELYLRWLWFGVFSPINRLHSTSNELMGKEPWNYPYHI